VTTANWLVPLSAVQGEEGKVVVISLVRNNAKREIGFMKMHNRVNVLLSRAQHGMVLLGNAATLREGSGEGGMWSRVLDILQEQGCVGQQLEVRLYEAFLP
jgi:superfamily I DNA and/or RNA helicase